MYSISRGTKKKKKKTTTWSCCSGEYQRVVLLLGTMRGERRSDGMSRRSLHLHLREDSCTEQGRRDPVCWYETHSFYIYISAMGSRSKLRLLGLDICLFHEFHSWPFNIHDIRILFSFDAAEQKEPTDMKYVDPAMIGILAGMALMFIIICIVLRLFSQYVMFNIW